MVTTILEEHAIPRFRQVDLLQHPRAAAEPGRLTKLSSKDSVKEEIPTFRHQRERQLQRAFTSDRNLDATITTRSSILNCSKHLQFPPSVRPKAISAVRFSCRRVDISKQLKAAFCTLTVPVQCDFSINIRNTVYSTLEENVQ